MGRIHYWELQQYNSGTLVGKWFDLDGKTEDEHNEEIQEWLEELTASEDNVDDNLYEEYIVGDHEDVPREYVGEYSLDSEFFAIEEAVQNTGYDIEVIHAAIACDIPLDKVEDAYAGEFSSDREMAEEYI